MASLDLLSGSLSALLIRSGRYRIAPGAPGERVKDFGGDLTSVWRDRGWKEPHERTHFDALSKDCKRTASEWVRDYDAAIQVQRRGLARTQVHCCRCSHSVAIVVGEAKSCCTRAWWVCRIGRIGHCIQPQNLSDRESLHAGIGWARRNLIWPARDQARSCRYYER